MLSTVVDTTVVDNAKIMSLFEMCKKLKDFYSLMTVKTNISCFGVYLIIAEPGA